MRRSGNYSDIYATQEAALKITLLTSLAMLAFAANSIFNRLSLAEAEIGPTGFALIRVLSGAIILLLLVQIKTKLAPPKKPSKRTPNLVSVLALTAYILGFSFAYVTLDAGIGALILFGGVQVTMFAGALIGGEHITRQKWFGSGLAFAGLIWLLAPNETTTPGSGALLMIGAAIGWGVYSLNGRKVSDPLHETQLGFLFSLPIVVLIWAVFPDQIQMTQKGILFAILSGAITSGLGYALWYWILPQIDTVTASVAQLTVPALAMAGGITFLNEPITIRFLVAAGLILSGVVIAVKKYPPNAQSRH